jgi:hypothetical protein
MPTGAAWNTADDPEKPTTLWDSDADIKIPVAFAAWLAELGVGYGSHDVLPESPLTCPSEGTYDAGSDTVLIRLTIPEADRASALGRTLKATIRLMGDDGTTQDDRTLYLKVKAR